MPKVQLLPCQPSDVPDVVTFWYHCTCQHQAFIRQQYWCEITPHITDLLYQHYQNSLIAVAENRLVGFITAIDKELAALFVDSGIQRTGIGSALLQDMAQQRELNLVKVYALNGGAIAFYHRHGFREVSRQLQPETNQLLITMQR